MGATGESSTDCWLRTHAVALGYGGASVLEGVSIEICRGDFWCWLGTNGAGKTSLLRVLLGLMPPQSGRIERHLDAGAAAIGFVPQHCAWSGTVPTTVREFVELGLVGIRTSKRERADRLGEVLRTVDLEAVAGADFGALSGGQRQRAMIARALIREPVLLVLDEPTASLDLAAESAVLDMLAAINRDRQVTIVFVTHDLDIAAHYATHVALFHQGRVEVGRREDVLRLDNLQRLYGRAFGERLGTLGGHCL